MGEDVKWRGLWGRFENHHTWSNSISMTRLSSNVEKNISPVRKGVNSTNHYKGCDGRDVQSEGHASGVSVRKMLMYL